MHAIEENRRALGVTDEASAVYIPKQHLRLKTSNRPQKHLETESRNLAIN